MSSVSRAVVYLAVSQDGFIADKDGGVEWLNEANAELKVSDEEDSGLSFNDLLNSVDAMVMGRKTYESVLKLTKPIGPYPWPYGKTPILVLTHNKSLQVPDTLKETVSIGEGNPEEVFVLKKYNMTEKLREKLGEVKEVYVDGGNVVRQFFDAGLADKVILTRAPRVLGDGTPLFSEKQWAMLDEVSVKNYGNGWSQTLYKYKGTS